MLLSRHGDIPTALDTINNYYEHLVIEELQRTAAERFDDIDFIADVACVALNHLPARYIRHNVDMVFYLTPEERTEMSAQITTSVADALAFVEKHHNRE